MWYRGCDFATAGYLPQSKACLYPEVAQFTTAAQCLLLTAYRLLFTACRLLLLHLSHKQYALPVVRIYPDL